MKAQVEIKNLGLIDYLEAWKLQTKLFEELKNKKQLSDNQIVNENYLLVCQHPHVYTLGKSGDKNNLLIGKKRLQEIGAKFYKTDRGGDITYHGQGQLVVYPIFNLDSFNLEIQAYIDKLEQAVIETICEFGIVGTRLEGATGVWLLPDNERIMRKICAIGVRISRRVSMHGLALNVNTDLSYFEQINPCGFLDKGVTSMQNELSQIIDTELITSLLVKKLSQILNFKIIENHA